MKALPASPSLSQVNTRVWLTELSRSLGRAAPLDDMPDAALDRVAGMGFDGVWFLSVWRTGPVARGGVGGALGGSGGWARVKSGFVFPILSQWSVSSSALSDARASRATDQPAQTEPSDSDAL
jgi:hypothetical protein